MSLILKAAALARKAHEGQKRKYGGFPYIIHPARVAGRVGILPDAKDEMVAAAYLHDVLEDTAVTLQELENAFGRQVAYYVNWMTNASKERDLPRAERKRMDRERLREAPFQVKQIKLLDRIDNLSEMSNAPTEFVKLYVEESLLLAEELVVAGLEELVGELRTVVSRLKEGVPA